MKTLGFGLIRLFVILPAMSALIQAQSEPVVIPLWVNGAPGYEDRRDEPELARDYWVRNIHNPSITVFRPPAEAANGCAVVIAPGGGFRELVFDAEGRQAAEYLNSIGVTAFALKYRLPDEAGSPYSYENVREDAYRAMRLVRSRAAEFGIDPHRIGMLGFSAGGAVVLSIVFEKGDGDPSAPDPIDRVNGRPDFQMMVYPGGDIPDTIPGDTPPAFLLCANDDDYGCDDETVELFTKFRAANVPVELHMLAQGKHAFNMGDRSDLLSVRHWPERMKEWLIDSGWLQVGQAD